MKFLRLWPLLLLVFLIALLAWRSGIGARQLSHYSPEEYVDRADRFIRSGYLVADCSREPMRLVPRLADAPEGEKSWYGDSYLAADVERFNADPEVFAWAFTIDNDCRLRGVNPVVHAIDLPFTERVRWLGNIHYQGEGSDVVLRSAGRAVTLKKSAEPISTRDQATTRVGSTQEVVKEGVVLLHFAGGRGQPAARLYHIGDDVVVSNRVRSQRPEAVKLMGHQLPVGMMSRLETGDWLHLEAAAPSPVRETFVYVGGEALETASRVRRQNERFVRKTEDAGLGLVQGATRDQTYPFLEQVARTLDNVLAILPDERAAELSRGFDIQLTVRRDLQLRLSRVLRDFSHQLRRDRDLEPFAAGVTVMDAMSGEILALATYPHAADIDDEDLDTRTRRRLLRNQNMVRHPIGSAGKPFFFAAIADAYPELLELEIAGHGEERRHRDLFQCEIPTGYQLLAGHGERVDFRTALEVSCNKYTIELATLALAADLHDSRSIPRDPSLGWPAAGQPVAAWVAGRALDSAPDLGEYIFLDEREPEEPESTAVARCGNLDRFDQLRYRHRLEVLTGAATYRGQLPVGLPEDATERQLERGYTTNRYDLSPWGPLIEHLLEGADDDTAWRVRSALQEISPDRVNLAFNQVTQLRADYISLLLGGGSSIWTNVQLAESASRLVTGKKVEARIVADVLDRQADAVAVAEEASADVDLEIAAAARRAVLDGMERVVAGGRGTAKELRDELEALRRAFPGEELELYSKTGSPVLERAVPGTVATALQRLVSRGRLAWEGGRMTVRAGSSLAPHRRRGETGRDQYLKTLGTAVAEVGYSRSGRVFRALRHVVDQWMEERRRGRSGDQIDSPLRIAGGVLALDREDRLFANRLLRDMGSVYVMTLTKAGGEGERALTVAIHLETGPDSSTAVAVAEKILPELESALRGSLSPR